MKRVTAQLKVIPPAGTKGGEAPVPFIARVLLNDISPNGMGLFIEKPFMVGDEVAITLENPKRIYLRGRIVSCQEYDIDSHILTSTPYSYRIGIQFSFESSEEEDAIRDYCEQLFREHLFANAA